MNPEAHKIVQEMEKHKPEPGALKPVGASGRHGGDDWFSRPVVARIFTQAGQK